MWPLERHKLSVIVIRVDQIADIVVQVNTSALLLQYQLSSFCELSVQNLFPDVNRAGWLSLYNLIDNTMLRGSRPHMCFRAQSGLSPDSSVPGFNPDVLTTALYCSVLDVTRQLLLLVAPLSGEESL